MNNNSVFKSLLTLPLVCSLLLGGCATVGDGQGHRESPAAQDQPIVDMPATQPLKPVKPAVPTGGDATRIVSVPPRHDDLWDRIRDGYGLPEIDSPHIADYEKWYSSRPEYVARLVERANRYLFYIVEQVEARGMPMEVALLPAIESAYKPHALSRSKAMGIWQFIPSTGRLYGLKQNWWYDGRKDIVAATQAALNYLEKLNRDFAGDWTLALAAYNAGEGTVSRAMARNARAGRKTNYTSLSLRRETRHYVPKLIAFARIVKNPERYGIQLASIPNAPYFSTIQLGSQIDLNVVADASGIAPLELEYLNPGFLRWATDPDGPHRLLVPVDEAEHAVDAIAGIPQHQRVRWAHYKVRKGDTLSTIARRHGVTVAALQSTNNIRGSLINVGQDMLIPLSTRSRQTAARQLASTGGSSARSVKVASAGKQPITVSVKKGDTLWSLARHYNVSLNELARWNRIEINDLLQRGQKITIWR